MLKKVIVSSMVAAAFLFSGCGSTDSDGEDRLAAQHAIDSGDSATAIAILEAKPASSLTNEDKMTLASAYMQEAEVSIMDIVSKMDAGGDTATFATLANEMVGDDIVETADKVKNIDKAISYYESMSTTTSLVSSRKAISLTDSNITVEGAKLYLGMAYMSKVTMLLSFFGDIATLEGGSSSVDESYRATSDIIKCVYNSECAGVSYYGGIDFDLGDGNTTSMELFGTQRNGNYYIRLASDGTTTTSPGSLLIANYENLDTLINTYNGNTGNITLSDNDLPFGSSYNLEVQLLDAINGAFDLIIDQAPDDVKDDINEYLAEVDLNGDGDVSMDEIRAYMVQEQ